MFTQQGQADWIPRKGSVYSARALFYTCLLKSSQRYVTSWHIPALCGVSEDEQDNKSWRKVDYGEAVKTSDDRFAWLHA